LRCFVIFRPHEYIPLPINRDRLGKLLLKEFIKRIPQIPIYTLNCAVEPVAELRRKVGNFRALAEICNVIIHFLLAFELKKTGLAKIIQLLFLHLFLNI